MEYTDYLGSRYSEDAGEEVNVLLYTSTHSVPYCDCTRCGKPIKRRMYVIQSKETDVELMYLGSDCFRKLK